MEQLLMHAIRMNNLKPPDGPFDRARFDRAEQFAERVMSVIQPYCNRPGPARDALVAAAYVANARIAYLDEQLGSDQSPS